MLGRASSCWVPPRERGSRLSALPLRRESAKLLESQHQGSDSSRLGPALPRVCERWREAGDSTQETERSFRGAAELKVSGIQFTFRI